MGALVAQLIEWTPHVWRLCPRCSDSGFDPPCDPLLHVIPSPPNDQSSCPLNKVPKSPQNVLLTF